ncbi:hypothetical protein C8Q79DRAFT_1011063 [Trametes meyenii]|nr:hypothetical protein C8Q79DRAFT_1011063 [Trametes meyenii]
MAAARPKLAVFPSGAERAWGTVESAPPAPSSFLDLRSPTGGPGAPGQSSAAAKGKAPAAPQPNVKKMRRRVALLSGVHLNLPTSPVVGPSPPGSSREMAWTFTAEWDSTQDEIVFSEVEGGSSSSSSSSSSSLRFIASPIPFDVCEDEVFDLEVFSPPPAATSAPHFSDMLASSSSSPSSSSVSSPTSPAVSDIFDFYTHSPATLSFSHHERNGSVSTAPSSPVGPISPTEQLLPSYYDSRCDPPVISVTFCEEREDPARGDLAISASEARAVPAVPAIDTYPRKFPSRPETRPLPTPVPSPPSRPIRTTRLRPLPPVPVRVNSMVETVPGAGAPRRDDRPVATSPQILHAPRAPPSAYSPPSPSPSHVRAASLGHGTTGRSASKRVGLGKHFRSISAALTGSLHHRSHC